MAALRRSSIPDGEALKVRQGNLIIPAIPIRRSNSGTRGKNPKTGKPRSTYPVRCVVAGKRRGESFQTKALAESFRSS